MGANGVPFRVGRFVEMEAGNLSHNEAVNETLKVVSRLGHRAFRRDVGNYRDLRSDKVHKIGYKGEADVQGWLMGGYALAIEVKTGNAVRTEEQEKWAAMFQRMGGCYILARWNDCNDGETTIKAAIEEYLAGKTHRCPASIQQRTWKS